MTEEANILKLVILSEDSASAEQLVRDVQSEGAKAEGCVEIGAHRIHMEILAGEATNPESLSTILAGADAVLLAIRHVDVLSLEKVRAIYTHLSDHEAPQDVVIARADGEGDFKMSCPSCAQKLWVRDTDVDKRGRCPSCKKAFTVPSQVRELRNVMPLPEEISVKTVFQGNPSTVIGSVEGVLSRCSNGVSS